MTTMSKWVRLTVACAIITANVGADAAGLLKDTAPGGADGFTDLTDFWVPFDGDVVFSAGTHGLWRSDGTSAGTVMLQSSVGTLARPQLEINSHSAITADTAVFFLANDGFYGTELWRTDGTSGGALRLTDLTAGSGSPNWEYWNASNGQFFVTIPFTAYTTDGSNAASVHVFGGGSSQNAIESRVLELRGKYYFSCSDNFVDGPCVKSGSTTTLLTSELIVSSTTYVAVNEKVFFTATTMASGTELWVTDGTAAGTKMVADLATGTPDSNPNSLTRMDDKLYFIARDLTHGYELWTSDGTTAGTTMLVDLNPGSANGAGTIYGAIDGTLYFSGYSAALGGNVLYRTDGTAAGTQPVITSAAANPAINSVTIMNRQLVIGSSTGSSSFATVPWISDGTQAGTHIMDKHTGLGYTPRFVASNGKLVFPGLTDSGNVGFEPLEINLERVTGHAWCSYPEKTIPDNGTLSSTIKLPEWGSIENMSVDIDIAHTYAHDLRVRLVAPDATSVDLINRPTTTTNGNCNGDLIAIHLADGNATPAQTSCSSSRNAYPLHANFSPAQNLATFAGKSTKGQWTLVADDLASSDIGTLHEWCVNFTTARLFFHDLEA